MNVPEPVASMSMNVVLAVFWISPAVSVPTSAEMADSDATLIFAAVTAFALILSAVIELAAIWSALIEMVLVPIAPIAGTKKQSVDDVSVGCFATHIRT